jgi:hypothetical protein
MCLLQANLNVLVTVKLASFLCYLLLLSAMTAYLKAIIFPIRTVRGEHIVIAMKFPEEFTDSEIHW